MGWETINARCTFLSGSKCSCSSKPCTPAPCFIKIACGFHLPLIGLTSALPYSPSGTLRAVAPSNASKELWETRALLVSAWLPLVLYVLCLQVLDPEVRTELNLALEVLCRPKRKGKRCLSESLPDQLWVTCILFLSIVVSWLWKCFCIVSFLSTLPTLAKISSFFASCQWHKMRQSALLGEHPLERSEGDLCCTLFVGHSCFFHSHCSFFVLILDYCLLPLDWIHLSVTS